MVPGRHYPSTSFAPPTASAGRCISGCEIKAKVRAKWRSVLVGSSATRPAQIGAARASWKRRTQPKCMLKTVRGHSPHDQRVSPGNSANSQARGFLIPHSVIPFKRSFGLTKLTSSPSFSRRSPKESARSSLWRQQAPARPSLAMKSSARRAPGCARLFCLRIAARSSGKPVQSCTPAGIPWSYPDRHFAEAARTGAGGKCCYAACARLPRRLYGVAARRPVDC
jgi:hypothetical protein